MQRHDLNLSVPRELGAHAAATAGRTNVEIRQSLRAEDWAQAALDALAAGGEWKRSRWSPWRGGWVLPDDRAARLWSTFAYATFIGNQQAHRDTPDRFPSGTEFREYFKLMLHTLVPRPSSGSTPEAPRNPGGVAGDEPPRLDA